MPPIRRQNITEHQLFNFQSSKTRHAVAEVEALDRSQAVIEFGLDGTILDANENLLKMSGYSLAEIKGKHHSIFVSPAERESARYRDFWASLNRGEFQTTQYRRYGKNGKEVWVHASYAPLLDESGKVISFIKFATDITAYKMRSMEEAGKLAAISRAQAVAVVNEFIATTAAAAEEQSAVTADMSANMQRASAELS
ncbi:PAS domain S-box-containing protein [Bradyrhizobium sp. AZCC 2230]